MTPVSSGTIVLFENVCYERTRKIQCIGITLNHPTFPHAEPEWVLPSCGGWGLGAEVRLDLSPGTLLLSYRRGARGSGPEPRSVLWRLPSALGPHCTWAPGGRTWPGELPGPAPWPEQRPRAGGHRCLKAAAPPPGPGRTQHTCPLQVHDQPVTAV